jgi:hypothetical protein
MRNEAARVGRPLMHTVAENELIFGANLHVVARFELAVRFSCALSESG